jgi:uncharacterized membrane protein YhaH (DUF805 family)
MTDSRRIAGLLGPTLIVLSASEAVNAHIWANVPATQVYLAGSLWFVAGLSIVRAHNRWTAGWPVLVTLVGWFAILGGLFRMFAPEFAQQSVPSGSVVLAMQAVLLVIGVILTVKAYGRDDS